MNLILVTAALLFLIIFVHPLEISHMAVDHGLKKSGQVDMHVHDLFGLLKVAGMLLCSQPSGHLTIYPELIPVSALRVKTQQTGEHIRPFRAFLLVENHSNLPERSISLTEARQG